ncbi:MAG: carbon-nitrogen hydrolase family protein [candidate division KSB1 bacterium]|nr:carbon-nitrogen hydrolase family protein [candidate division KSB1 bacterium]
MADRSDANSVRVAAVQAGAYLMDNPRTLDKALQRIDEAVGQGAKLIVFPEAYLPGYPRGLSFGAVVGHRSPEGRNLFARYQAAALSLDSPEIDKLRKAAKRHSVYLAVGIVEKAASHPRGTLYCTLLIIDPAGEILHRHRKLKPTASERLIWGEGDGRSLDTHATPFGRIGGLICWENYMPLARMALYRSGIEIYLAPTADSRDSWQASMRHIACEGRCFVITCNQFVTREHYPADLQVHPEVQQRGEVLCRGGSAILDPYGRYLAGPLYDEEGILYADLNLSLIAESRFDFDVAGHYARHDVFRFQVKGQDFE